jgi:uncharacterized protein involved in exopolysaccharide biosynthesis
MTVSEHSEISLLDVIDVFWRRRWLMGAIILIVFALSLTVAFVMTPVYRATVVLASVEANQSASALGDLGGLAALAGLPLNDSAQSEEAIAKLESRSFTGIFIADQNLMPVLFAPLWDADKQEWTTSTAADTPSIADGFAVVDGSIRSVVRDGETGLLALHIDWTDPELAARWANRMVEMINHNLKEQAISEAQRSIEYLNDALTKTAVVEARAAMYRLMETQINNIMLANVREEFAFKVIDPAVIPEVDDFIKPNRLLLAVLGLAAGLGLSAIFSLGIAVREKSVNTA